jgi:hypothetical protein
MATQRIFTCLPGMLERVGLLAASSAELMPRSSSCQGARETRYNNRHAVFSAELETGETKYKAMASS